MRHCTWLLCYLICCQVHAFTAQKTSFGSNVRWNSLSGIHFYLNPTNASSFTDGDVYNIVDSSLQEWANASNNKSGLSLDYSGTSSAKNDIYFSDSSLFFAGTSVLAITQNVFDNYDGSLLESDIIVKENSFLSNSTTSEYYLGNIITHELGHAYGLGHSEEIFSSMFYKAIKGQHKLESDDSFGIREVYNIGSGGRISGKIAGSNSVIPIFGAVVKLVSSLSGTVIASVLSNEDGSFSFSSLDLNDVYYLYIEPIKQKENMSSYYSVVRDNFCFGDSSFQGSFHESCSSERRGMPQGIKLTSSQSTIDLGYVTARCGQNVPLDYFSSRDTGGMSMTTKGNAYVGYFTSNDLVSNDFDQVNIDLTSEVFSDSDLYLDVKVISHDIYSPVVFDLDVSSYLGLQSSGPSLRSDLNTNLNVGVRYKIDETTQANNIFTVKVTPQSISDYILANPGQTTEGLFPESSVLLKDQMTYALIYQIVKKDGTSYTLYDHYNYENHKDSQSCMDAPKTYRVISSASVSNSLSRVKKTVSNSDDLETAVSCASVANVGGGSGPGGGLILYGISFIIAVALSRRKSILDTILVS